MFCYEAGPCGYGSQRQLSAAGHECVVVTPSLIPLKAGDRIKTDRRAAINLAKLHRAGELTPVWVPDQAHEAVRDLVRPRLAAVRSLRQEGLARPVCEPAWKAQTRLCGRYRKLSRLGKPANVVTAAIPSAVIPRATHAEP